MKTALALLVVVAAAVGVWWYFSPLQFQPQPPEEEPVFCTQDAMQCPDGSYVGRTGPNCEFVCPDIGTTTQVSLFYYNPALDQGPGGAQCSEAGLVEVRRVVPANITLVEVIEILLKGELRGEETAQGIETEFPLEDLRLASAEQVGSVLTLTFTDSQNKTSGGACRAGVLWLQIEATAKAFTGASTVRFMPEELFQP
ncbi:MAG: hypothetical protein Q8P58_02070 [Candidatus Adlerbacteria bacterium]|nr:hypothetical protein [Candidatus Adlerbacteria bacterium]MDZ4226054.1 hypothetical protein [Patescibacteria group bacterium]